MLAAAVRCVTAVDEKDFKKHLKDLAHGHHHPEEHDWAADAAVGKSKEPANASRRVPARGSTTRKAKRWSKTW